MLSPHLRGLRFTAALVLGIGNGVFFLDASLELLRAPLHRFMKGLSMRFSTHLLALSMLFLAICVFTGCPEPGGELTGSESDENVDAELAPNELSEKLLADGWISLFDGESLYGWQDAEGTEEIVGWSVEEGVLAATADAASIQTTSRFGEFTIEFMYRGLTPDANLSLSLHGSPFAPFPMPEENDDQWIKFTTDIKNSEAWASAESQLIINASNIELHSIRLRPLGSVSLFNGEDLTGWNTFPELPTEASVMEDGALQLLNGSGMIETEKSYGDFIFQTEAYIAVPDINSGVFFRCIPGDKMNGYESQLNNTVDPETGLPDDCGTGGIFRRQNARKIIAEDETGSTSRFWPTGPTWRLGSMASRFAIGLTIASPILILAAVSASSRARSSSKDTIRQRTSASGISKSQRWMRNKSEANQHRIRRAGRGKPSLFLLPWDRQSPDWHS